MKGKKLICAGIRKPVEGNTPKVPWRKKKKGRGERNLTSKETLTGRVKKDGGNLKGKRKRKGNIIRILNFQQVTGGRIRKKYKKGKVPEMVKKGSPRGRSVNLPWGPDGGALQNKIASQGIEKKEDCLLGTGQCRKKSMGGEEPL